MLKRACSIVTSLLLFGLTLFVMALVLHLALFFAIIAGILHLFARGLPPDPIKLPENGRYEFWKKDLDSKTDLG